MSFIATPPPTTSAATSGYIIERRPDRFGGNQEYYVSEVKKIVASTAARFRKAGQGKEDLIDLFYETLNSLSCERRRIAEAQKMPNAQFFGRRRDHKDSFQGPVVITPLLPPYESYNERVLRMLQTHLRGMDHSPKTFTQKELSIDTGKDDEIASRLDIRILTYEDRNQWVPPETPAELRTYYHKICALCRVPPKEDPFHPSTHLPLLIKDKEAMERLKHVSIEDYEKLKLLPVLGDCKTTFPSKKKSDWVFATVSTEIDGKMVELSQYVTWMFRDGKSDPVEQMIQETPVVIDGKTTKKIERNSEIVILHQDPFLIDPTLTKISKLFKRAIECNRSDLPTLSKTVAHLRYLYSQAMPYLRGSAAMGEWLEQSIYLYQGYDLEYKRTSLVDMEALTIPPNNFAKIYPYIIKMTKNNTPPLIEPVSEEKGKGDRKTEAT